MGSSSFSVLSFSFSYCSWGSQGKNTEVVCHSLLQWTTFCQIKLPTSAGSSKKQENSRKTSISALLTMPKPLTVWITINCRKFWKRWAYQTTLTCLLRNLYAGQEAVVRTGHETTDWLQIAKEVHQGIYCHPAYLTYMQSTSWEMLDWTGWSTSWNQDFQEKYQ